MNLSLSDIPDKVQSVIGDTASKLVTVNVKGRPVCVSECVRITSKPPSLGTNLNQVWTYQVLATDSKGQPLTYSLSGQPSGASIDSTTGLIKFSSSTSAAFDFAVNATSNTGVMDTQQIHLTVCPAGQQWMDGMGGMCM